MKTILVTGGAGFIGANFIKRICNNAGVNKDYRFIILDALTYAGNLDSIKSDLDGNDLLEFIHGDIRNEELIEGLFSNNKFDGVINFAAESHVDRSIESPNIFVETNVLGTLNLLNHSLKTWKENNDFIYLQISTDEVYGDLTLEEPAFTEEHPITPSSPYSSSKASGDLLVQAYYRTYGMPILITRCSNNYGPYQYPEKLIPLMISKAKNDEKLPVYGDGTNVRDWIYVDDHNDGVWEVFKQGTPGNVYNLGGNSELKNIDVVKSLLSSLGKSEDLITYVTDRLGHDYRYAMNYSKAEKELSWSPKVTFSEGLKKTILWYEENEEWVQEVQK